MTIRPEGSHIPDLGGGGMRGDLRMTASAAGVGDRGQPHLAAMLHVALRAAYLRIRVRGIDEFGRMRGAIVALPAGLIGDAAEGFGMTCFAALLDQRVSFGERTAGDGATAATHAHYKRHACQGRYDEERPR